MSVLFAGGENSEVSIFGGSMVTGGGTDIKYRFTYARGAINPTNAGGGARHSYTGALLDYIIAQGTACDFWYGFQYKGSGGAITDNLCVIFANSGIGFFRIHNAAGAGPGTCTAQLSTNGSSWTDYPGSDISQPAVATEWTFRIKRHATLGKFQWWIAGALWWEFTGDTTGYFTTCNQTGWGGAGSNADAAFSEVVATSADDSRVGMNCATLYYTGDGADTDWTGGYADVAELSESTATVQTTAAVGDDSSYLHTNVPALAPGIVVRAVVVSGKWRTTPTAPQNLSGYLRISGTNYDDADDDPVLPVEPVPSLLQYRWHLSPATGVAFTEAEVNALEPGMRSVA